MEERISRLIEVSKDVILSCSQENGAFVAANPTKDYYSKEAKHYFYVWPRDGGFNSIAADIVGIQGVQEKFFSWIEDRAEGLDETGLLYEKYFVNGPQALHRFQPDQGSLVLLAIWHHFKDDPQGSLRYKRLINKLTRGYVHFWDENTFKLMTNDPWEERHTFPDLQENFAYSLAACMRGLKAATSLLPDSEADRITKEMGALLMDSAKETKKFYRSFGKINDFRTDASLLGLIWPFEVIDPGHEYAQNTVNEIIEKLVINDGLHRYEHDEYDGWMYKDHHRKKGAGYWPLLNFWLAIVLNRMGRREEAFKYFDKVLNEIDQETLLIPEQIFNNDIQKAVSPLCWSHTMFILAAKELGLF